MAAREAWARGADGRAGRRLLSELRAGAGDRVTDEGREIARIEVERVESRDDGLHVTGRVVPPRIIDGDVLDGEVLEGEVIDAGSGVHYPHCNSVRCTGCIAQEVVDDYAGLWDHIAPLLAEGFESLLRDFEANAPYLPTHPRGHRSAYVIVDEVQRVSGTYITIDEAREWAAPTLYPEARAIEEPRLTWSDIQIKGLGNGT